jgi:hypothetical protein
MERGDQGAAMSRQCVDWNTMIRALEAYRKENGHCCVPANWRKNPQLGRWVAMHRYRRKIGELSQKQIDQLDRLHFVWSPTDIVWNEMFGKLVSFKTREGHCDVPSVWPEDPQLASWVANQRHRRKSGSLSVERIKKLDELGFAWALYGKPKEAKAKTARRTQPVVEAPQAGVEQRLYHACGEYVQYDGHGEAPAKLARFLQQHDGEYPPYIPLPAGPVTFTLNNEACIKGRKVRWDGQSRIPDDVREYVNENGVLPPHD